MSEMVTSAEILQAAKALAALVREEYPRDMPLSYIASTYGQPLFGECNLTKDDVAAIAKVEHLLQ